MASNTNSLTTPEASASANSRVTRVRPSPENILAVWADLRSHDAVELEHGTVPGELSLRALTRMVREDKSARCMALDGTPVCLWGLNRTGNGSHPWMLATPRIREIGKYATREARAKVRLWRVTRQERVWNIVLADSPNVRWLERVGFALGEPFLRDCPNGERAFYRPFWIE